MSSNLRISFLASLQVSNSLHGSLILCSVVKYIDPLRPSIKLQILLLCFHTFLTEVVGRSC